MRIYQVNAAGRVARLDPKPAGRLDQPHLLVAHPDNVEDLATRDLPRWLADDNCRAVLVIKGVSNYCGLIGGKDSALKLKQHYGGRVHFLSYAVPLLWMQLGRSLQERFTRFFNDVLTNDRINWSLLDPEIPENLLAAYLLAVAMRRLRGSSDADLLLAARAAFVPLLAAARDEHRAFRETSDALPPLELEGLDRVLNAFVWGPIPCDVSSHRDTLEHSWLKRTLLEALTTKREEWAGATPDVPIPRELTTMSIKLDACRKLLASVVDGYSPAPLVEQGRMREVAAPLRALIRQAVHAAYLDLHVVQPAMARTEEAVARLDALRADLERTWSDGNRALRASFLERTEVAAQELSDALKSLPPGVVLP